MRCRHAISSGNGDKVGRAGDTPIGLILPRRHILFNLTVAVVVNDDSDNRRFFIHGGAEFPKENCRPPSPTMQIVGFLGSAICAPIAAGRA